MDAQTVLFESPDLTPWDICLWGWEERSLSKKVDTRNEKLARILGATFRIMKREERLRRTSSELGTRVEKFIEYDGGIFEIFIMQCNKYIIYL